MPTSPVLSGPGSVPARIGTESSFGSRGPTCGPIHGMPAFTRGLIVCQYWSSSSACPFRSVSRSTKRSIALNTSPAPRPINESWWPKPGNASVVSKFSPASLNVRRMWPSVATSAKPFFAPCTLSVGNVQRSMSWRGDTYTFRPARLVMTLRRAKWIPCDTVSMLSGPNKSSMCFNTRRGMLTNSKSCAYSASMRCRVPTHGVVRQHCHQRGFSISNSFSGYGQRREQPVDELVGE